MVMMEAEKHYIKAHRGDGISPLYALGGEGKDGLLRIVMQVVGFWYHVGGRGRVRGRRIGIDVGRMGVGRSEVGLRGSCDVWMSIYGR